METLNKTFLRSIYIILLKYSTCFADCIAHSSDVLFSQFKVELGKQFKDEFVYHEGKTKDVVRCAALCYGSKDCMSAAFNGNDGLCRLSMLRLRGLNNQQHLITGSSWTMLSKTEFIFPHHCGLPSYDVFDMLANNISFVYTDTILFKVKSRRDAHVLLQTNRNISQQSNPIELVLGGWWNSKSALRAGIAYGPLLSEYLENAIVNGECYSSFWITSTNSCILVGKGADPPSSTILQYCRVNEQYKFLSIGVGLGSWAKFLFL